MRVAVTHDWLGPMTGAERVLEQVLLCYPGADVFTAIDFLPERNRHILHGARVFTSFVQRLPRARTKYWNYIPLMPLAFEQFDLESYDLVISCSHTAAKGVIVHPHQVHVCYLHSPMRFAWDLQPLYLEAFGLQRGIKSMIARAVFHRLRVWDTASAARVDAFIANSHYVARRAELAYRRSASVVYPPCDLRFYDHGAAGRQDFYLAASRLTPFKRIDLLVEAFREMPDRRLIVIGDGPERERIRRRCTPNITMLGYQSDEVLRDHMQRARAFLFAAPEDFGIVMAEAQACGTPVIALGRGGALEIVRDLSNDDATGMFFADQKPHLVRDAVRTFEALPEGTITPQACRANALRFSPELFRASIEAHVNAALEQFAPSRR